jgi:hypothetical protein
MTGRRQGTRKSPLAVGEKITAVWYMQPCLGRDVEERRFGAA